MLNICVSFDFSIMKKFWDLAHEKLVNILGGHCVESNIYGCRPYLKIAIYVLKSTNGGLFYTPLYVLNKEIFQLLGLKSEVYNQERVIIARIR